MLNSQEPSDGKSTPAASTGNMVSGLSHEKWNEEEQRSKLALAIQALYEVGRIISEESCKKLVEDGDDSDKKEGEPPAPEPRTAASSSSSLSSLGNKEDLQSESDLDEERTELLPTQSKEDKEKEEKQSKIWQWKGIVNKTSNNLCVKELQPYFIETSSENLRFRYCLGQMYRYLLFLVNSTSAQDSSTSSLPNYDFYRYQCNASEEERKYLLYGLKYANEQYKNQFQDQDKNNVFFGIERNKNSEKAQNSSNPNNSKEDPTTDDGSGGAGKLQHTVALQVTTSPTHILAQGQGDPVPLQKDLNSIRKKANQLKKTKVIHSCFVKCVGSETETEILEQPIDGGELDNGSNSTNIERCTFYFSSNKVQNARLLVKGSETPDTMISSPDIDSIYRSILVLKEMGYQAVDIEQLSAVKDISIPKVLEATSVMVSYQDIAKALLEKLNLGIREGNKEVPPGSVSSDLHEGLDMAIGLEHHAADSTIELTKTAIDALETFKIGWKQKLGHTLSGLFMNGAMLGYSIVNAVFFGAVFASLMAFPPLMVLTGFVFLGTWFTCKLIYQNIFPQTIANTIARLQDKTFWKSVWTFEGKDGKSVQLGPGGKVALIIGFVCAAVAAYSLGSVALQATMGLFALAGMASNPVGWAVAAFVGISILIVSTVSFMRAISSFIKQENRWQSVKDYFSRLVSGDDYTNQSKLAKGIRVVVTVAVWFLAVVSMFAGALIGIGASEYVTSNAFSLSKTVGNWIGFFSSVVIGGIAQIPFTLSTVGKSVSAFCKNFFEFCQQPIKSIRDWWQKVDIKQSLQNFFGSFVTAGKEAWQDIRNSYEDQKLEWKAAHGFGESCVVGINRVISLVLSPIRFVFSYFEHLLHRDVWRATNAVGDAATAIVGSETYLTLGDRQISMDGGVSVNSVIGVTQGFSSSAGTNIDTSREKLEEKPSQQAVMTKALCSPASLNQQAVVENNAPLYSASFFPTTNPLQLPAKGQSATQASPRRAANNKAEEDSSFILQVKPADALTSESTSRNR